MDKRCFTMFYDFWCRNHPEISLKLASVGFNSSFQVLCPGSSQAAPAVTAGLRRDESASEGDLELPLPRRVAKEARRKGWRNRRSLVDNHGW